MKNFSLVKNGFNWISVEDLENGDTKSYQFDNSIETREDAVRSLLSTYGSEISIDGTPATECSRNYINKGDFRNLILTSNNTIKIGDVSCSQGVVYNPRVNEGRGYQYLGEDREKKLVNNLWRIAKKIGMVSYGNEDYYIINQ